MQLLGFHMGTTPAFDQPGRGLSYIYDKERKGNLELELSSSRGKGNTLTGNVSLRGKKKNKNKSIPLKNPTTVQKSRASGDCMALFLHPVAAYFPVYNGEGLSMLGFALLLFSL